MKTISKKECAEIRYRRRHGQTVYRVADEIGCSPKTVTVHARDAKVCPHDQAIVGPPAESGIKGRDIPVEVPENITAERIKVMVGLRDGCGNVTENSVIVTGQKVDHEVSVLIETFAGEFSGRVDYLRVKQ